MFVRAYLRASTLEQDALRAKIQLEDFVSERGLQISATYLENFSGATLARPALLRLLSDCLLGDVILVEQVDRLSRLSAVDWVTLRSAIDAKNVRIVALDLPTSWHFASEPSDEFSARMYSAINGMMLDVLAAVARKDYEDRRRRQAQGQARAVLEGRYKGRPENTVRNTAIAKMLASGLSWSSVQAATGCSRATVLKISKRSKAAAVGAG